MVKFSALRRPLLLLIPSEMERNYLWEILKQVLYSYLQLVLCNVRLSSALSTPRILNFKYIVY